MAETKMQLVDWLDDLCVRFIINLPQEELESVERICFQVEEAQWFYEDFIRPLDPTMPSLNLRQFCLLMFQHCPLLAPFPEHQHLAAFDEFLAYKVRVPVRGAILLNQDMDEVVLVRGWKKNANWSFPRGKINKDEDDLDCAIREVYEETGFDIAAAGLVPERPKQKFLEVTMREQHMKLFVFRGVPQDTMFQPRTRKEISKIQWYKLANLPGYHKNKQKLQVGGEDTLSANKLYMVAPFMQPLKRWIALQRKLESAHVHGVGPDMSAAEEPLTEGPLIEDSEPQPIPQPDKSVAQHTLLDILTRHQPKLAGTDVARQPSGVDTTAELKRLLSIRQPSLVQATPVTTPTVNANASNLLALLRQAPAAAPEAFAKHSIPVQTPQEQINRGSDVPDTPRHDRTGPQLVSGMPPPLTFPFVPSQVAAQQLPGQQPYYVPTSSVNRDGSLHPLNNNIPSIIPGRSIPAATLPLLRSDAAALVPVAPLSLNPIQPPRPYQRTGDPQFARPLQAANQFGSTIPSASQLPAPKLSSHAQSLLEVFKSSKPRAPSNTAPSQTTTPSATTTELGQPLTPIHALFDLKQRSVPATEASQAESCSRQYLSQLASAPVDHNPSPGLGSQLAATELQLARSNTQHEALLNVFQSPSVAVQALEQTTAKSRGLAPAAKDLSAVPKSLLHGEVTVGNGKSTPKIETGASTPALEPSHEQLPAKHPRGDEVLSMTSATVSRPANVPDIGSVKRKTRAAKSPLKPATNVLLTPNEMDSGTVRRTPRAPKQPHERVEKHPPEHRPVPIQILRRPSPDLKPDVTPATSPEKSVPTLAGSKRLGSRPSTPKRMTNSKASSPKPPTPKPFQPQILRRPPPASLGPPVSQPALLSEGQIIERQAAAPFAEAVSVAAPTLFVDRGTRKPVVKDQKDALLSLFGKAKALGFPMQPITEDHPASVVSPVSVASPPNIFAAGPSKPLSNSFHGHEVPMPPPPPPPPMDLSRSRMNSMASVMSRDGAGSGSQTPISPSDRGFLLNYLRGL